MARNESSEELVRIATSQQGAPGQGATAELIRRLTVELASSTRTARWVLRLTWALLLVTVLLGWLAWLQLEQVS